MKGLLVIQFDYYGDNAKLQEIVNKAKVDLLKEYARRLQEGIIRTPANNISFELQVMNLDGRLDLMIDDSVRDINITELGG